MITVMAQRFPHQQSKEFSSVPLNMDKDKYIDTIYQQTMGPGGFLSKLRENDLDEEDYKCLLDAVNSLSTYYLDSSVIDKLVVACLYEVPWEVENCIDHYSAKDSKLGLRVSRMSENLREAINKLLWAGLEDYYKDI